MGVLSHYYHLFNQNFTGWRDTGLRLNATLLTDPQALFLWLTSKLFPGPVKALVDLGSSDLFLDSSFVALHKLSTWKISPLPLSLLDGTVSNFVKEIVTLPIHFACGLSSELDLFVTPLVEGYPVILGYNWLRSENPMIDWAQNTTKLTHTTKSKPTTAPPIALIGATAFKRAC